MLGKKSTSSLLWFVCALLALFMAFTKLGTAGGILVTLGIVGFILYRRRSTMYHNTARKRFTDGDTESAIELMKKAVLADPANSGTHA